MEDDDFPVDQPAGGSGAVSLPEASRLTGIPEAEIEGWETEFHAVHPTRDPAGNKGYSAQDIDRLKALKSLEQQGHPLSEIARLPLSDLYACLGEDTGSGNSDSKPRVVVAGVQLAALLEEAGGIGNRAMRADFFPSFDAWAAAPGDDPADLLVLECPGVFPETVALIQRRVEQAKALRAVVVYQFLKGETLESMEHSSSRITALRAPVTARELKEACEADLALAAIRGSSLMGFGGSSDEQEAKKPVIPEPEEGEGEIPARQFSDAQLSKISQISTAIHCECPHHLAALLSALNAFEHYSRDCENRNEEDAALHAFLHRRTARARSIMEDALSVLAEAEGIKIP